MGTLKKRNRNIRANEVDRDGLKRSTKNESPCVKRKPLQFLCEPEFNSFIRLTHQALDYVSEAFGILSGNSPRGQLRPTASPPYCNRLQIKELPLHGRPLSRSDSAQFWAYSLLVTPKYVEIAVVQYTSMVVHVRQMLFFIDYNMLSGSHFTPFSRSPGLCKLLPPSQPVDWHWRG